jgi:hypothetical protein
MPLVQMSDNNVTGQAESHFRNLKVIHSRDERRRQWFDRGGGARVDRKTDRGVPYYVHDYFGEGRTAKIVLDNSSPEKADSEKYIREKPITGREAQVAEVSGVEFPELLSPIDDLPPATIITSVRRDGDQVTVRGITHDNGEISSVKVNDKTAKVVASAVSSGLIDWEISLPAGEAKKIVAAAADAAGNVEKHAHAVTLE